MTMLTGRVAGKAVSAAMSYRTDIAIGIYGVTTIESARGRGYASALTHALIDLPGRLYLRLTCRVTAVVCLRSPLVPVIVSA